MSLGPVSRDLRLDFLRGVALLVVLVDHIEDQTYIQVLRPWMPVSTCFFDGAEAFVFLSGMVFGRVFQYRLERDGLLACQVKSVKRAFSIYLMYLITIAIVIGIGFGFGKTSSLLSKRLNLDQGIGSCLTWSLAMCYQPWGFPILAVYSVILPFMPLLLFWRLRSPMTAWIVPLGVYIATQMISGLQFPRFPGGGEWTFNPFAWQLLFFVGMSLGSARTSRHLPSPVRALVISAAVAILVLGVLIKVDRMNGFLGPGKLEAAVVSFANHGSYKIRLGPTRLIHFTSFGIVLSAILPETGSAFWRHWIMAPVIKCGQNSLVIYSFGVILMFLTIPIFHSFGESKLMVMMVEFDSCAASVGVAYLLASRKLQRSPCLAGK